MATDLRAGYHEQLNEIQVGIARMSAGVTELVPRVTDILLESDLESAEYVILGDDAYDVEGDRTRGDLFPDHRPAGAGRRRPPRRGVGDQDHRRRRALGGPVRQHLQSGPTDLRTRARPAPARGDPEDGQPGAGAVQGVDRGVPQSRRPARGSAARHGLVPRRPPPSVHPDHLREPRRRHHRPAGRSPARGGGPVLRADRRSRGEHGRPHAVHRRAAGSRRGPTPRATTIRPPWSSCRVPE